MFLHKFKNVQNIRNPYIYIISISLTIEMLIGFILLIFFIIFRKILLDWLHLVRIKYYPWSKYVNISIKSDLVHGIYIQFTRPSTNMNSMTFVNVFAVMINESYLKYAWALFWHNSITIAYRPCNRSRLGQFGNRFVFSPRKFFAVDAVI